MPTRCLKGHFDPYRIKAPAYELWCAIRRGRHEDVRKLLRAKTTQLRDNPDTLALLVYIAGQDHLCTSFELCLWLLEDALPLDRLLYAAVCEGENPSPSIARVLLTLSEKCRAAAKSDPDLLSTAVRRNSDQLINILVEFGADPSGISTKALAVVFRYHHEKALRALKRYSGKVDWTCAGSYEPWTAARESGYKDGQVWLMNHGGMPGDLWIIYLSDKSEYCYIVTVWRDGNVYSSTESFKELTKLANGEGGSTKYSGTGIIVTEKRVTFRERNNGSFVQWGNDDVGGFITALKAALKELDGTGSEGGAAGAGAAAAAGAGAAS